jgi:hypothetical protein
VKSPGEGRAERRPSETFLQRAAQRRARMLDMTWRQFFADLGLRFVVVAGIVLAVVILLWLVALR